MNFIGFFFICVLPLTASSQNTTDFPVTTGSFSHEQVTQKMSNFTTPISDVNTKREETTAQTPISKSLLPETPINSILSHSTGPTNGINTKPEMKVTTSATIVVSNRAGNQNTVVSVNPTTSSSYQSQETGMMSTSLVTSGKTTHLITSVMPSTKQISTTASSTIAVSIKTPPATGGDATKFSTTKAVKTPDPTKKKSEKATRDSKIVAGLIGGALLLMMVGFLFIYLKKLRLRKQQITTSDWAGPSPFLEGGADNGGAALRSSNRISLSGFLPQRLSKRLSLLQETDEELEEITPGTTFGSTYQGTSFGREVDGNGEKERNGTAAPEKKSAVESAAETVENSVSAPSSQTNDVTLTNENSVDQPNPPTPSDAVENTTDPIDVKEN